MIRVFVGTDPYQRAAGAELVLEHTIRKHAKSPVHIEWMRAGDPPWFDVSEHGSGASWKLGRPVHEAWSGRGTATPFSAFRYAIPEMCGFSGTAIYLDADMLVLGDIAELAAQKGSAGYTACHRLRTDVSIVDCGWFRDKKWWPSVEQMRRSGWVSMDYLTLLHRYSGIQDVLSWQWNDLDGAAFARGEPSKLIHYTHVLRGQPYRPYPGIEYPGQFPFCDNTKAGDLWWCEYHEALKALLGPEMARERIERETAPGWRQPLLP